MHEKQSTYTFFTTSLMFRMRARVCPSSRTQLMNWSHSHLPTNPYSFTHANHVVRRARRHGGEGGGSPREELFEITFSSRHKPSR